MRQDATFLAAILDSLKDPVLVADTNHTICYMNRAAIAHFKEGEALIGRSLLACHSEASQQIIQETLALLQAGEEERFIGVDKGRKVYMRAIRGSNGRLLGYYERYE